VISENAHYVMPVPVYQTYLAVEWVREADWDQHWMVVLYTPEHRDELSRHCTFTEGKKMVQEIMMAALQKELVA